MRDRAERALAMLVTTGQQYAETLAVVEERRREYYRILNHIKATQRAPERSIIPPRYLTRWRMARARLLELGKRRSRLQTLYHYESAEPAEKHFMDLDRKYNTPDVVAARARRAKQWAETKARIGIGA